MPYVATKQPYMLMIIYDEDAQNPREDGEPFGTMTCWHSRYDLGDKHEFDDQKEFLKDLARENINEDLLINEAKQWKLDDIRLSYNRSSKEWELSTYSSRSKEYVVDYCFYGTLAERKEEICDRIIDEMSSQDLEILADKTNVILPLYLYDHSGITISTAPFSCKWDSGQVGWIYASREDIEKEYGSVTTETIEKATEILIAEVKTYDNYLGGENYGFKLFKDGEETDSCWGFLGDIDDVKSVIAEHLPDECKDIVSDLDYIDDSDTRQYEQGYEDDFEEMEAI